MTAGRSSSPPDGALVGALGPGQVLGRGEMFPNVNSGTFPLEGASYHAAATERRRRVRIGEPEHALAERVGVGLHVRAGQLSASAALEHAAPGSDAAPGTGQAVPETLNIQFHGAVPLLGERPGGSVHGGDGERFVRLEERVGAPVVRAAGVRVGLDPALGRRCTSSGTGCSSPDRAASIWLDRLTNEDSLVCLG